MIQYHYLYKTKLLILQFLATPLFIRKAWQANLIPCLLFSSKFIISCNKTVRILTCGVSLRYVCTARSTRQIPVPWSYDGLVHPQTGNIPHSVVPMSSSLTFSQSCVHVNNPSIWYHSGLLSASDADNCGCLHNPLSHQPGGCHMGITGGIISNHRRHPVEQLNSLKHKRLC